VIGAVGVFRKEKGHRVLIDAFARVHAAESATRLEIIGGGPLHQELQARVNELGLQEVASIEPSTQSVRERLQKMHIFVLPSFSEAQSNALLEAMACGCCVLATRVGGNPEVIDHGQMGELFEAGDVGGLAARLLAVVRDPALRSQYGQAGASTVRERFSLPASVNRMQSIYERILEN
jgi:glycosyltransferase involved in cell wall biosynthesis